MQMLLSVCNCLYSADPFLGSTRRKFSYKIGMALTLRPWAPTAFLQARVKE